MPHTAGSALALEDPHTPTASTSAAAADPTNSATAPRFDTKIVVVLRDDLAAWQELNVTAFLMSGIATSEAGVTGEPYRDRDGNAYLPMLRQPVVVMTGDAERLGSIRTKAVARGIPLAVYTKDLFATGHDEANRAAVAAVASGDLDLVGIALRGPRNAVDRLVKGASLHA
ncbi:hypothetical protein SAMN05428970_2286 [Agromyces sp. CF514]|uniref:DUF2000 family protein n=1 Tax=Agromyces sp. CF514 TaxID=1881031 RepID=UPI0008ED75FD|nr:DUF2000 family protein [Agromyces sp. CF514]SFR77811.1 hypothetical protein SAMN05428970_2286 [Agromyces sp. CF514]